MNGIENIINKIIDQAQAKANEALATAKTQSDKIMTDGNEWAEAAAEKTIQDAHKKAEDIKQKAVQNVNMERRKTISSARQEVISHVFNHALSSLLSLPEEEYISLLTNLALKALKDGEGGQLVFNEKDSVAYGAKIVENVNKQISGERVSLSPDFAPISGGVVIKRDKIELNGDLEVIIRMLSQNSSASVYDALFPKGA